MKYPIYPCLWFDGQASEVADFYSTVFDEVRILETSDIVITLEIEGVKFMFLDGGPHYKVSPAVSYYVYCRDAEYQKRIYERLTEGGQIKMSLDEYIWSKGYAWVQDRFGVNWQLDIAPLDSDQRIIPTLLFSNDKRDLVKSAIDFYTDIFPDSHIVFEAPYPETEPNVPEGTLLFARFSLMGYLFNATSSTLPHDFDFSVGNSVVVECRNQEEIDHYWDRLTDGGREDMCGWLQDRFGVSWQIIPRHLDRLLNHPETGRAAWEEMMKMRKIDIRTLQLAGTSDKY